MKSRRDKAALVSVASDSSWQIQLLSARDVLDTVLDTGLDRDQSSAQSSTPVASPNQFESQWQTLCRDSITPNVFFEPGFLLPALAHLDSQSVSLLLIWASSAREELLALIPLIQRSRFYGVPVQNTAVWRHPYCYLCTPLLSRDISETSLLRILGKAQEKKLIAPLLALSWLDPQSPCAQSHRRQRSHETHWRFHRDKSTITRASLHVPENHAAFLASLRTKKRKDLFRTKRRLQEQGNYCVSVIDASSEREQQSAALVQFLALENQGWKQREGTSIASNPAHTKYFTLSVERGLLLGQVLIVRITLNDDIVAMLVVLVSACGRTAYTQKIAINTQFERFSPGSLIILELTEHVFSSTLNVSLLDSCAAQNHPMIDALWRDRLPLSSLTLVKKHHWQNWLVASVNTARNIKKRY